MRELFKYSVKSNYKMLLLFMGILTMYFVIIARMYDPNGVDFMDIIAKMKLPVELLEAFGFSLVDSSLVGFLSSYYYGLLMIAFPMIFYIILANKLVASLVDRGSMAHLLASPHSRLSIILTQLVVLVGSITLLVAYVTILGIVVCEIQLKGLLAIDKFILINLGVLLLHLAISSISFLSSCVFNESRKSLFYGAGIPIFFLIMQMLASAARNVDILPYLTLNSLYKAIDVVMGESVLVPWLILGVVALSLYGLGVIIFNKKDIPV